MRPEGAPVAAAVVCHAHPLQGGVMHFKVVFRAAKALQHEGLAALRFNFRGVGRSHGVHDQGRGEQDDLRAAIEFMENKYADAEIWLAGFSFGAAVMLRMACAERRVRALVAAGAPMLKYDFSHLKGCDKPMLFVQGTLDEYGPVEVLKKLIETLDEPKSLKLIEGADHFFEGHLPELAQAVSEFIHWIQGKSAS